MKTIRFLSIFAGLFALAALPLFGQTPTPPALHPYEAPAINFQGRIEVGDIGYDGTGYFRFTIGDSAMSDPYWGPSVAETTVVEGVYNIILGQDTDALTKDVFADADREYFLKVEFCTNGTDYEELLPYQEILTVPFAVNADLLDGKDAPGGAIVGTTDAQTLTSKILTSPVINTVYFTGYDFGEDPTDPGYIAYDSSDNVVKYWNGEEWVSWGDSGTGITGSGTDNYIAYWTGAQSLSGDAYLQYDEQYQLTLTTFGEAVTALKIDADTVTSGKALEISSSAAGGTSDKFVHIVRGGTGRALEVNSGATTGSAIWFSSTTVTTGTVLTVKNNNPTGPAGGVSLSVEQDHVDSLGRGMIVIQDGLGEAARFTLSSGLTGDSAIWVEVNRDTHPDLSSQTGGGAIHVDNRINTGPALTAYSTQTDPLTPMVWFKVAGNFKNQPVVALEGVTGRVSPLRLVPLTTLPDEDTYTVQTGELFARGDGTLHFFDGEDWIDISAQYSAQTYEPTSVIFADTEGDFSGDTANLSFDGIVFSSTAASFTNLTAAEFTVGTWATIAGFSTDTTLGGDEASDDLVSTQLAVKSYIDEAVANTSTRWITQSFTRGDNISLIGDADVFQAGVPIRFAPAEFDFWRYGMVVDCTAGDTYDDSAAGPIILEGHPLEAAYTVLQSGNPEMVRQINLVAMGNLPGIDLLPSYWCPPNAWYLSQSCIVRATAELEFPASGDDAVITLCVGPDTDNLTELRTLNMGQAPDPVHSGSVVLLGTPNIDFNDKVWIRVDQTGTGYDPGTNLLVTLQVVTP